MEKYNIEEIKNTIICSDTLDALKKIPDESINCIVSSPPYFQLRQYGVKGEIGLENSPEEYVEKFRPIFREMKRVLKKEGSIFWNISDSYAAQSSKIKYGVPPKCLCMIPEKIALMAIEEKFILRNKIIWRKNNFMPASVRDRLSNSFEFVYFFTKNPKYYFDLDAIRIPHKYFADVQRRMQQDKEAGVQPFKKGGFEARHTNPDGTKKLTPKDFETEYAYRMHLRSNKQYKHKSSYMQTIGEKKGHWVSPSRAAVPGRNEFGNTKKTTKIPQDQAESFGSPRARYHRKIDKTAEFFQKKGSGGNVNLPWRPKTEDESYKVEGMRNAPEPGEANAFNIKGKNPSDCWVVNTKPFLGAHFACVDAITKALTEEGWKGIDELTLNDKFATFDYLNEKIIYHKPYEIFKYNYDDYLITINNQWISQHITPNHRVLLKYVHSSIKKWPDKIWRFIEAKDIKPFSGVLIPNSGYYKGKYQIGTDKAELLGWIITEGCISQNRGITIYQSNSANPDKVKRIEQLLKNLKIDYTRSDREKTQNIMGGEKIYTSQEISFYIKKRGNNWLWIFDWLNKEKKPKWKLLHLYQQDLKALYRGIILGDGHHRKDGRESLTQKDNYVRLWFRTLCIHVGKRTTEFDHPRRRSAGTVFVTHRNHSQIHQSDFKECISKKRYKGIIWCPYLPNGTWITKRNNKISISGNTFPEELVQKCILAGCPKEGIILDPFIGSGTVGSVAKRLKRNYIGIDLKREYCELAEKRIRETPQPLL